MPSKVPQFRFRNSEARKKLESLNIDPDRFAQAILRHAAEAIEDDRCPVCGKSFNECEYFQRLENE